MAAEGDPFITALRTIESAHIPANDATMLRRFVGESLSKIEAARYVLDRLSQVSQAKRPEDTLLSIKTDLESLALKGVFVCGRRRILLCAGFLTSSQNVVNRDDRVPPELNAAVRERENHRCCVTGSRNNLSASYIVSPSILQDEELRPGVCLLTLLLSRQ